MSWFSRFTSSSIGKKFFMGLTGVLLMLFLILHLIGNLTLFFGEKAFTDYAGGLETLRPIVRVIEVILATIFIVHIYDGIKLWFDNRKAKPVKYAVKAQSKDSSIYSRTTVQTGSIIFIFLVIHLQTFWYPNNFEQTGKSLYQIVTGWFADPVYSLFYVFAMILLGLHLNHGFQSAFQTFGWNHKKYFPTVKKLGTLYAILMAAGFASIPLYFLISRGGM